MSAASYIDSSSLLKVLWNEPESPAVRETIAAESRVVVSALVELEVEVQLRAQLLGGGCTKARYNRYQEMLVSFRSLEPFEFLGLPGSVFNRAIQQHLASASHCRTLDRLHLTAMSEFRLKRLVTNDAKQGAAAKALGYTIVSPGMEAKLRPD